MFERYTESARRVIFWARYIASQIGSQEIQTEHLLLGLLRQDMRLAHRFLGSPFAMDAVWRQIVRSQVAREKPLGPEDPLTVSHAGQRVLAFAVEDENQLSNGRIGTVHLLLGLLREETCFAAEILQGRGVLLASTREELARTPHDDSVSEEFVRDDGSPPEVAELQARISLIKNRASDAANNQDFAKARAFADDERTERNKLYLLCREHELSDWLYV
jgi:ATP-dependent Clp protease ATP-binding subunit ClpC